MSAHTDEKPFVCTECDKLGDASKQVFSQTKTTSHKHESILHLTNYNNSIKLAPMTSITKILLKFKNSKIPHCKVSVFKCFSPTNNQLSVINPAATTKVHATNLIIILYKSIINYYQEPPLVTKCHILICKILQSASSRLLYRLKINMSAIKSVYHLSVVVSVKYIVLLLVLIISKYLTIVCTTHIVYRMYDTSAIKTIYQIILCTNPYVWHNSALRAIVTVYIICVLVIVKCLELVYTKHIGCNEHVTSAIVTLIQMCDRAINEYLETYIIHTLSYKSVMSDKVKVYHLCPLNNYKNLKLVYISHITCICLYQMHISLNLIYVNIVAKNNVKVYLLHESLSVLVFELYPIEDLLARYHTNGEIICRELASKTKKSHLIKLPKYIAINIITSYIPNIKTLYPL